MLPLDVHAHIAPQIPAAQLRELDACVIAVTRSLEEFEAVTKRVDPTTAWAVGCHPLLAKAQRTFSEERLSELLPTTAIVGEVGLDGTSRVPMEKQRAVLRAVLAAVGRVPRVVSIHSYRATREVLDELEAQPIQGVILHWWLGEPAQTQRALRLGCRFTVNSSSVRQLTSMGHIPFDRILTETDHPYGDRYGGPMKRPGAVADVETALARHYATSPEEVRTQVWRNLTRQVLDLGCFGLLPESIRSSMEALGER